MPLYNLFFQENAPYKNTVQEEHFMPALVLFITALIPTFITVEYCMSIGMGFEAATASGVLSGLITLAIASMIGRAVKKNNTEIGYIKLKKQFSAKDRELHTFLLWNTSSENIFLTRKFEFFMFPEKVISFSKGTFALKISKDKMHSKVINNDSLFSKIYLTSKSVAYNADVFPKNTALLVNILIDTKNPQRELWLNNTGLELTEYDIKSIYSKRNAMNLSNIFLIIDIISAFVFMILTLFFKNTGVFMIVSLISVLVFAIALLVQNAKILYSKNSVTNEVLKYIEYVKSLD